MCGISGIVGNELKKSKIEAMTKILNHRGPDDNGYFISNDNSVGLGHNRLSIIDLSKSAHQPMSNFSQDCWITFNGEIYNYLELKQRLGNYPFQSKSDTEVILASYQKWGEECVNYFNGMFAFAIWDEKRKKLFCARDRVGIKPFYYLHTKNSFYFASEIKAILAAGIKTRPNWKSWSNYLVHGVYDHSEETFFDGIFSLNSGHSLILKDNHISIKKYWDINSDSQKNNYDLKNESEKFLLLLKDSLKLRLRSDVTVGVNLSGGLDSSSLMIALDEISDQEQCIEAFTATFDDQKYDEYKYSRQVKTKANWNINKCINNELDIWNNIEEVLWHQEAPFGGVGTIAYHNLHKTSKEMDVTVLLEGQGVDEMLAGYSYYINESNSHGSKNTSLYQDGTKFLAPNCISEEIFNKADNKMKFANPFKDSLTNNLYRDFKFTKLPRVLRMNDHLSMASSRELREPFLDHRIVEYLFSLPDSLKIYKGQSKYLLREAMVGKLPESIRSVKKRGVVNPQREWFKNELKEPILDLLHSTEFSQRGIFDQQKVLNEYSKYCDQGAENSFFIWQWVNTEMWFRIFD